MVVLEQTTEPFATLDLAFGLADFFGWIDELVVEPLMITLAMIMKSNCQLLMGRQKVKSVRAERLVRRVDLPYGVQM